MGGYGIIGLFLAVLFLAIFFTRRFSRRMIVSSERRSFSLSEEKKPEEIFEDSGRRRAFETADYALPEKDFMEEETTEFPDLSDELIELSEAEAEEILKESGLYLDEEERDGEK